jgi:YHS domain-containing protein
MNKLKFLSIIVPLALMLFSCDSKTEKNPTVNQEVASKVTSNQKFEIVPNEKVCMVNDRFMVVEQIPIEVDGITYYGCCQNCVKKLQENIEGVRYAKDPISGKKVDKASATIVQNKEDGMVKYFESRSSAEGFINK